MVALAIGGALVALTASSCVIREVRHCPGPYPECNQARLTTHPGIAVGPQQGAEASTMPPEALAETYGEPPDEGAVWVEGYWHWNGTEWVWINGRWVDDPGSDYVYVEPSYEFDGGYCVYSPGYWDVIGSVPSYVVVIRDRHRPPRVTRPHVRDNRNRHVDVREPVRDNRDRGKPPHGNDINVPGPRPPTATTRPGADGLAPVPRPRPETASGPGNTIIEPIGPRRPPHQEPRDPTPASRNPITGPGSTIARPHPAARPGGFRPPRPTSPPSGARPGTFRPPRPAAPPSGARPGTFRPPPSRGAPAPQHGSRSGSPGRSSGATPSRDSSSSGGSSSRGSSSGSSSRGSSSGSSSRGSSSSSRGSSSSSSSSRGSSSGGSSSRRRR